MIAEAKARGMDVTAEVYPYQAGMDEAELGRVSTATGARRWKSTIRTSSGRRRASGSRPRPSRSTARSDDYAIIFSIPESAVNAALVHPQC